MVIGTLISKAQRRVSAGIVYPKWTDRGMFNKWIGTKEGQDLWTPERGESRNLGTVTVGAVANRSPGEGQDGKQGLVASLPFTMATRALLGALVGRGRWNKYPSPLQPSAFLPLLPMGHPIRS